MHRVVTTNPASVLNFNFDIKKPCIIELSMLLGDVYFDWLLEFPFYPVNEFTQLIF